MKQVRKRGQSHSESCSEHQMDKTGALGARMHGVLASGLGAPTRKDNTASASALPNSNSRGKVHFNGMKKLEEEEEEVDEGEGSDAYAAYINKINNHSHTSHPAPSSQVKSYTDEEMREEERIEEGERRACHAEEERRACQRRRGDTPRHDRTRVDRSDRMIEQGTRCVLHEMRAA